MAQGEFDLLLGGTVGAPRLQLDRTRPESELAQLHVLGALRRASGWTDHLVPEIHAVEERGSRYIDFLVPGLIGLNLLGAGLYGIGFNLVQMRARNLLRRLAVTPMLRSEFLLAFLVSRLVLVVPESLVITVFGVLFFGVRCTARLR